MDQSSELLSLMSPILTKSCELERKEVPDQDNVNQKNKNHGSILTVEDSFEIKGQSSNEVLDQQSNIELFLDSLYGNSWRPVENDVLLKSEPYKSTNKQVDSERKTKIFLHRTQLVKDKSDSLGTSCIDHNVHQFSSSCANNSVRFKLNFTGESETKASNISKSPKNENSDVKVKKNNFKIVTEQNVIKSTSKKVADDLKKMVVDDIQNKVEQSIELNCSNIIEDEIENKGNLTMSEHDSNRRSVFNDEECNNCIRRIVQTAKDESRMVQTCSFLESLSESIPAYKCDPSAKIFRDNFKYCKDKLAAILLELFNVKIFSSKLSTDVSLIWSDRLRGTAGYCTCKELTKTNGNIQRTVRIVLSTKVLDSADRLRDTLLHELCHAATWIINGVSDGHGPFWKLWAHKAMNTFPELPSIKRCHDYIINTKYTYKCTGCGYSIGRHTKSLDIARKRCGNCHGKFHVFINKTYKKGETKTVPATPKKEATGFALFVKENYSTYKNPLRSHGDTMKILGQKFAELKIKPI